MNTQPPQVDAADVDHVVSFIRKLGNVPSESTEDPEGDAYKAAITYARVTWPAMSEEWIKVLGAKVRRKLMWASPSTE